MDTTTQVLSILVLLIGLIVTAIVPQFVRRRRDSAVLRRQAAYAAIPAMATTAVEAGQSMIVGMGDAGVGGESTLLAIAAEAVAYHTVAAAAYGDRMPAVTTSSGTGLPLAIEAVRAAFREHNLPAPSGSARWIPAGSRSLAYAAAMTAYVAADRSPTQVMVGRFGPEIALIGEASVRRGAPFIGATDRLDGQAVAYAFSKAPLIGEELFQASAYLSDRAVRRGEAVAMDILRWLLIAAVIAVAAARIVGAGG